MYCEFRDMFKDNKYIIDSLEHRITDQKFHQYYRYYGTSGCSKRNFEELELKRGWEDKTKEDKLARLIYSNFSVGDKISLSDIKLKLKEIYNSLSLSKSPKANDIKEFFNVSRANIQTDEGISNGYKLKDKLKYT